MLTLKRIYPEALNFFNSRYCIALWLIAFVPIATYGQESAESCLNELTSAVVQQYEFQDASTFENALNQAFSIDTAIYLDIREPNASEAGLMQKSALYEAVKTRFSDQEIQGKKLARLMAQAGKSDFQSLLSEQQHWVYFVMASKQLRKQFHACMASSDYPPGITSKIEQLSEQEFVLKLTWNPGESERPFFIRYVWALPSYISPMGSQLFFRHVEVPPYIGISQRFRKQAYDDVRIKLEHSHYDQDIEHEFSNPKYEDHPMKALLGEWEVVQAYHNEPKNLFPGFNNDKSVSYDWREENFVGEKWVFDVEYKERNGRIITLFKREMGYEVGHEDTYHKWSETSFSLKDGFIVYNTRARYRDVREEYKIEGNILNIRGASKKYGYSLKKIKPRRGRLKMMRIK